jgi:hypothetical protein
MRDYFYLEFKSNLYFEFNYVPKNLKKAIETGYINILKLSKNEKKKIF